MDKALYQIFFRSQLAATSSSMGFPLTAFRAKKLKEQLMREKGWTDSEITIKPVPPQDVNQGNN